MRLTTRVGIVLTVVGVAVAAALPFRKGTATDVSVGTTTHRIERRTHGPLKVQPLRVPTAATGVSPGTVCDAPDMPPSYQRTFSPVGALLDPLDEPSDSAVASRDEPLLLNTKTDSNARALTHKIADGDTLAALAKRYLGDAERWRELFERNREVLKDPDLLPIGRVIKVPPRERVASSEPSTSEPAPPLAPIPRGAFRRE